MQQEPESAARSSLLRSLLIYLVLLIGAVAIISYVVSEGAQGGAWITITVVGVAAVLLSYQALQHWRDLRSPLAETEGLVVRKFQRADLIIFWQSYYVNVDRTMFRVKAEDYIHLVEGSHVKVVHFPNTLNVVSIHEALPPQTSTR